MNFGTNDVASYADAFKDVVNETAIILGTAERPDIAALFGKQLGPKDNVQKATGMLDDTPNLPQFERMRRTTGTHKQVRLLGDVRSWEVLGSSFADMAAPVTPAAPASRGTADFQLAMLHCDAWMDLRSYEVASGDAKKLDSLMMEEARSTGEGLVQQLSSVWHGSGSPAADVIGSWKDMVASTGTYGGIDRSVTENANYVARQYSASSAAMTLSKWRKAQNKSIFQKGIPSLGILSETQYGNIQDVLDGEFVPDDNMELMWLKGYYPRLGPTTFVGSADQTDDTACPLIDVRFIRVYWKSLQGSDMSFSDYTLDKTYKAMLHMQANAMCQIFTLIPKVNVYVNSIA